MRQEIRIITFFAATGTCLALAACEGGIIVDGGSAAGPPGDQLWTGNPPDCPAQPPGDGQGCTAEAELCAYYYKEPVHAQEVYQAYACRQDSGGTLKWINYYTVTGFFVCPATQPPQGSQCSGNVGTTCYYPALKQCECGPAGSNPKWSCTETVMQPPAAPPEGVAANKLVKDLSAAELQDWCEWSVSLFLPEGAPQPPETPLTAEGYTTNTGLVDGAKFFCNGCMPMLPVSYCVGNLSLSSCEATVSELNDCVLTLIDGCWPYTHGCAPYLDKPGCEGTVIGTLNDGGDFPSCPVKVQ